MHIKGIIANVKCASCLQAIQKVVATHGGTDLQVNPITGKAIYDIPSAEQQEKVKEELDQLGYPIQEQTEETIHHHHETSPPSNTKYNLMLLVSIVLTIPLLLLHFFHSLLPPALHNPLWQLLICLPVYIIGWITLGKSGLRSLLKGKPNMNTLIIGGASAAMVYSLIEMFTGGTLFFFETTSAIIALVMLGEYFEQRSMQITQKEIKKLIHHQKTTATMIAFDDKHQEIYLPVESSMLQVGDLILIKSGERVPSDCKVLSGDALVDEALLSGESMPIYKEKRSPLYGGSILINGTVKAQVTAENSASVLSKIIELVEDAQLQKPPIQHLADKISGVFVPLIFVLALITFGINYAYDVAVSESIMRTIAVIVIACPCALGMATPAAISIGMGIAARRGIFFKKARELENFKQIKKVIFDKTGTLTKGNFAVTGFHSTIPEQEFKALVVSIEKQSNHPIAKSLVSVWSKDLEAETMTWVHINEERAKGMIAEDTQGNIYKIGSQAMLTQPVSETYTLYVTKNDQLIGGIHLKDEIKEEAYALIEKLKKKGIESVMISGDKLSVCKEVAGALGIERYYGEKSPEEKLALVKAITAEGTSVMIGDGINDAPSLSAATIGIAVSEASQLSIQAATVVFTNKNIGAVYTAITIGKKTYKTIISNLVWAFVYNVIAIPIAALGWLNPTLAALIMGLSDVFLILNSLLLYSVKYT